MSYKVKVLFVCLGNICRSPTAQAVFEYKLEQAGLSNFVYVDSCGTAGYHIGDAPDSRAIKAAKKRNYRMAHLTGRQLSANDFLTFDYILAMDQQNLSDILARKSNESRAHISLFLEFDKNLNPLEVPDPYYGSSDGFEKVLDVVETASDALIAHIKKHHFI